MKIPTELKHKPVITVEDYDKVDGRYSNDTDVKGLSLGLAQWNDRGSVDISAKVWRHTGQKWSRQSEGLPIHRILDLAILICKTKSYFMDAYKFEKLYDETNPDFAQIPLQGGAMNAKFCTDNSKLDSDIQLFYQQLSNDDELLSERFNALYAALRELKEK